MTETEFERLIGRDTPTMVDFHTAWLGACRAMRPVMETLGEQTRGTADIVRIDIDQPQNAPIAQRYRIMAAPTFILFRNGRPLWRESGIVPLEKFIEIIKRFDRVEAL